MHTIDHPALTQLRIEGSGIPIYVQLRDQLAGAIGAGLLKPGDQMPTMRQVAVALKVDLNTVRHAYDELERAGAISLERGRGSFVSQSPPSADPSAQAAQLEDLARRTIAAARTAGLDPAALARRIADLTHNKDQGS